MKAFVIIGAIWFQVIAFIIPHGDVNQLNKIPTLHEHYVTHQTEEGAISFIDFLVLHYSPNSQHDDPNHHNELPFFQTAIAGMFMPSFFSPQLEPFALIKMESPFNYRDLYQFEFIDLSFQPPRQG